MSKQWQTLHCNCLVESESDILLGENIKHTLILGGEKKKFLDTDREEQKKINYK